MGYYDPKKGGGGVYMARPETKIVEILWRAGTSPTCGTMAPSNEGEDLEQCPISPPSGPSSTHCTPWKGILSEQSTTDILKLYKLANVYTYRPYLQLPWLIDTNCTTMHNKIKLLVLHSTIFQVNLSASSNEI